MKQQIKVKLIRHGEKRLFIPDPGLTELGRVEAKKLADRLALENRLALEKQAVLQNAPSMAQLLLCSPKKRTQETAAIIGQVLQLPVEIDDFLNLNHFLSENAVGQEVWRQHFSDLAKRAAPRAESVEILAVTHSQNIRHYWELLAQKPALTDIKECGVWEISYASK